MKTVRKWKPSFPKDMTAIQACELAGRHWRRMARDPIRAREKGECPGPKSCALCAFARINTKSPGMFLAHCAICPARKYEMSLRKDASWLCASMFGRAVVAFYSKSKNAPRNFRRAAKPIIERIEKVLKWLKRGKK